jgi:tyrosine-protein phosphatase YwqE
LSILRQLFGKIPSFSAGDLIVDLHSHLLPGLDDGVKSMEESMSCLIALSSLGYKKVITTPHIMTPYYPNEPEQISVAAEEVKETLIKRSIDMELEVAAEYYLDDYFFDLLDRGNKLLTLPGNLVLIELSMVAKPGFLMESIFRILSKGLTPIIAHPERYLYFRGEMHIFEKLKLSGCLFQLNLMSLTGYYGSSVKKMAGVLLASGLIDYLGSDLHNSAQLPALNSSFKSKLLRTSLSKNKFLNKNLSSSDLIF